jgi:hypothetical protein
MGNAKHIGRIGALAAALGIGNVRRSATRISVTIGAAVLVVMAAAVPAPDLTVSPAVRLSADSTALIMGGTTIPTPDDYLVELVKNQYIAPTHPGQDINYVAVTAPMEWGPLTGLGRLVSRALGPPEIFGPGGAAWPDEPLWKLSGLFDLTLDQSVQAGVADLEAAMAENGNDHLVIYGASQGALIADREKRKMGEQYPAGTDAPDIDFVMQGTLNLPNGGLNARFPGLYLPILDWSFNGPAPTDTQFDTVVINRQYDFWADFPLYPINVIADVNALLGAFYLHLYSFDVSLAPDPSASPAFQGTHGDTSYYFFETEDLPLFAPLRSLGVPEALIDVVEPFFRVLVELGYDRSIPPWEPSPARLIPPLDPATVTADLVNAIGEGFNNALALIGLPPPPSTPRPVTLAASPTEAVPTEVAQTDISPQVTSTTMSTQTEQVTSTETATGSYRMPADTATRTDPPPQTEQLDSTEAATQRGQMSTNSASSTKSATSTNAVTETAEADGAPAGQTAASAPEPSAGASTSARGKPTLRPVTPRPVVRDSLGATEQPRGFPHRSNGPATSTTGTTAADPATTAGSSSASSAPAASSSAASNSSAGDSSGGDAGGSN